MSRARLVLSFCITSFLLFSCEAGKYEEQFYEDGQLKVKAELLNGKRHGLLQEYYPNGTLASKGYWRDGEPYGQFEEYYSNGNLRRKVEIRGKRTLEVARYYENGGINEVLHFDGNGEVISGEKYGPDGMRFDEPYPYLYISHGDTVKTGERAALRVVVLNIVDSSYNLRDLFVLNGFDTLRDQLIPRDTIAKIKLQKWQQFEYVFFPDAQGNAIIYGMVTHKNLEGTQVSVIVNKFAYPYYVVK